MAGRSTAGKISLALEKGAGILNLAPNWVPRSFCVPGRRLKLHPDDYYALGANRGGIDERWLASTTPADNGPLTAPDEGLSFVVFRDGAKTSRFLLRDAVAEKGAALLGEKSWERYGGWPMYAKFFDNRDALPFHVHHRDRHAGLVGRKGKPEAYYFPPQMNNHGGTFPYTFFGLKPGTKKADLKKCLLDFSRGDNRVTGLSQAYTLEPGTGWTVPAGVLHAPGSMCTYEPQKASDVFAMYQSVASGRVIPEEMLWKDSPPDRKGDYDYLLEIVDWEKNVDPFFAANNFMPCRPAGETRPEGYEEIVVSLCDDFSARELTVFPGRSIIARDSGAYGLIVTQGRGTLDGLPLETPVLVRYGELTSDEYFVSAEAAGRGVRVVNSSQHEPLVMLKHFGPGA